MTALGESALIALLRQRYPAPEYALFHGVPDRTGGGHDRTADAIVHGLWPSRGIHLHGFECKSARNDWLREKKDPAKAEKIAALCDFWWIVAGDEKIVKVEELPPGWGLLVPDEKRKKLEQVVAASKIDALPMTRRFLAAILRKAHGASPSEAIIKDAVDKALEERGRIADEAAERNVKWELDRAKIDLADLRETIGKFEAASGVRVADRWNAQRIGEAVRILTLNGVDGAENKLRTGANVLEAAARTMRDAADSLKQDVDDNVEYGVLPADISGE